MGALCSKDQDNTSFNGKNGFVAPRQNIDRDLIVDARGPAVNGFVEVTCTQLDVHVFNTSCCTIIQVQCPRCFQILMAQAGNPFMCPCGQKCKVRALDSTGVFPLDSFSISFESVPLSMVILILHLSIRRPCRC